MNKIIYLKKSLRQILLSVKAFDIYIVSNIEQYYCIHNNNYIYTKEQTHTINKYINNIYKIYNNLCIDELQYIIFKILKDYCNNLETYTYSKYMNRFQYIFNKDLSSNHYNRKTYKLSEKQLAIINIYILNQAQNKHGFYILMKYLSNL
nr:hypothetical protein [Hypnea sp.]